MAMKAPAVGSSLASTLSSASSQNLAIARFPLGSSFLGGIGNCVTSVPENSVDVASTKLTCQKVPSTDDVRDGDPYVFKPLWDNVLTSINAGVKNPPNFTKYQQNFCLVRQEVLSSNSYPFMDDEVNIHWCNEFRTLSRLDPQVLTEPENSFGSVSDYDPCGCARLE